jgi:hypothetical protein
VHVQEKDEENDKEGGWDSLTCLRRRSGYVKIRVINNLVTKKLFRRRV